MTVIKLRVDDGGSLSGYNYKVKHGLNAAKVMHMMPKGEIGDLIR